MSTKPRVATLFSYDWDERAYAQLKHQYDFEQAGFDLFSFPSNTRLLGFDLERFTTKLAQRAKQRGLNGVVSHHEQFGALAAAMLAEKLGLPGTKVEAVLACQHKLYARQVLQQVCPEANIGFQELPAQYGEPIPDGVRYPCFAKPIKAAFSVLARQVNNHAELQAHTRFGRRELWVIRRLVEPFEKVLNKRLPNASSAHRLLLEEQVNAPQYNLDGYMYQGQLHAIGVVDAVMYPGTHAFMRFDYPSKLAQSVQQRAVKIAQTFLKAIGFEHGFFNMEFFYDEKTQRLTVIEFNPRLASQLADLYHRVRGINAHAEAICLSTGSHPESIKSIPATAGAASSFVYRAFNAQAVPSAPTREQLNRLAQGFPDSFLLYFPKSAHGLHRDFKWLGSHRYAILHLGGADEADLQKRCEEASAILGFPAPYTN